MFGALVLIYLIISTHFASKWAPTGDEPHYLLISHSIIHDRDFDLANNYRNRDYLLYWPYGEIDAQISPASRYIYKDRLSRYIIAPVSAIMVAGCLILFYKTYGSLNVVTGQYGFYFSLGFIANGFLGRFIDQQFGIFIYSPWSIFFISGLILMLKEFPLSSNRGLMLWLFMVLMLIIIIPSSTKVELSGKPEWVGDYSMPHRYSVATMPFLIVFVCYLLNRCRRLSYAAAPLFVFSTVFSTVLIALFPQVLWDSFHEGSVLLSVISPAGCDLRALLPNLLMTVMPPHDTALVFSISAGIIFLNLAVISDANIKIYVGLFMICLTAYIAAAVLGFMKVRADQQEICLKPS